MSENCDHKNHGQVLLTLFFVSIIYNFIVDWMHREGYERGATAWLVVGGVAYSVLIPHLIFRWLYFTVTDLILIFIGSGVPMIIGDWRRYSVIRQEEDQTQQRLSRL